MIRKTDYSTLLNMLLTSGIISIIVYLSGGINTFVDYKSLAMVLLGTLTATFACFTSQDIAKLPKIIWESLSYKKIDSHSFINLNIDIAQSARYKGISSVKLFDKHSHPFPILNSGLRMYMDNLSKEDVTSLANKEISSLHATYARSINMIKKAAEIAPSMGLIGTLLGLVQMLSNLQDPDSLGSAMALALLTTLYGAIISFIICLPLATKLETILEEEIKIAQISLFTLESIGNNENPRNLESTINTLFMPTERIQYFT